MARGPIIPGNNRDRTGTLPLLRRAVREIEGRFKGALAEVLAAFDRIPFLAANDIAGHFMLTPDQMASLSAELQAILERWIADGREGAPGFWWSPYVADAAQIGAAQSVANLTAISATYAAARTLQQVVYSEPFRTRVGMAKFKSYEHWTGMAGQAKADLTQVIGRAVADGKNPRAVRTEIAERLGVSKSKALQFAQTDITDTLRNARWQEADQARDELQIDVGLLWTSALMPTTRPTHASRHGRVYQTDEVRAFYSRDGNIYRCHCSQTECLIEDGKPVLTPKLKAAMKKELATWKSGGDGK